MRNAGRQSGMTLVEVIVAAALALVGFLVALLLYQGARQAFRQGEQASDQQQEIRSAQDRMMKDLRLAGYNWNATGEDRPGEEQIEGAWSGAITVRADYDFEDGTLSKDPEDLIAGTTTKATVGNDEIVTFCLMKPDGAGGVTGGANLVFNADVDSSGSATSTLYGAVAPRDGVVDTVTIPNVDLTQTNPPYNLYRVYRNNAKSPSSPDTVIKKDLLAENVLSLAFTYLNANGAAITAPTGVETAAAIASRANIKKINVTIVGMTAIADNNYTDPDPTHAAAAVHYRKFTLSSQVTPRNIGFKGRADADTTPPTTPTGLATCPGHCAAMLVTWNANPSAEGVAQYELKWGATSGSMTNVVSTSATSTYLSPSPSGLTLGSTYYFAVRAVDAGGLRSAYSSTVTGVVNDGTPVGSPITTPSAPTGFTGTGNGGTGGLNGRVDLNWTAVTTNTAALTCGGGGTTIRDLGGYRLYRSQSTPFTPATGNLIVQEPTGTAVGVAKFPTTTTTTWSDLGVVNCRQYYYHLKAVDQTVCGNMSATWAGSYDAKASTVILPAAPITVTAVRTGLTSSLVNWQAVTTDTGSPANTIAIDTYKIYRSDVIAQNADAETANYTYIGQNVPPNTNYTDNACPAVPGNQRLYYKVSAIDDCPYESAQSAASSALSCIFNGTLSMTPANGATFDPSPKTVVVTATGTDAYISANLVIDKVGGTNDENVTINSGSPWSFTWTPNQGAGTYNATATVTNSNGCTSSITYSWTVSILSCNTCATITAADPIARASDTGSGANAHKSLQQNVIRNTCAYALSITQAKIRARSICTNGCTTPLRLDKIQYSSTGVFASEISPVASYTATSPGDPVSTTQTASVTFATPLNLPATSSVAKIRWFFYATTPIYMGTAADKKSVLEADLCFTQTASLCTPSCITNIRLEP